MPQAIRTRYLNPTDARGSRITANASAGRVIIAWDDSANSEDNHKAAALALCVKFDWAGKLYGGGLADGSMVWAFENSFAVIHAAGRASADPRKVKS